VFSISESQCHEQLILEQKAKKDEDDELHSWCGTFAIIDNLQLRGGVKMYERCWEKKIALLREFKRIHGHLRGIRKLNSTLARWTIEVRKHKNSLTHEQIRQLEELEFEFNPFKDKGKEHIDALLEQEQWEKNMAAIINSLDARLYERVKAYYTMEMWESS
jgi:hypothetical protein